jgi:hypothetical protein
MPGMHLIVPFAGPLSEPGRAALRDLALPQLGGLLAALGATERDEGEETSFTPPHERALARAIGFTGADGCLPWAARHAAADGLAPGSGAWGELTPAHWHLGTDQVSLMDPAALALDEAASRELFDAVKSLFTTEGFGFAYGSAHRWYLAHDSLATLRTASLDRVVGRNVDRWLTEAPAVRLVRRLQNEVQMLLYTHPINDRREAQGLLAVNSFWLSGCGVAQRASGPAPAIDRRLRGPALADDWAAWAQAWQTLDEGPLADMAAAVARGNAVTLTLCGERSSVTLQPGGGAWRRLRARLRPPLPATLLETL